MMGHSYSCDRCDFEFCSGWSHHAGGLFVVCPSCAAQFTLGDGQSEWGPREGETLRLMALGPDGEEPTEIRAVIHILPRENDEEWDLVVRLNFGNVPCPQCDTDEKLIQEFDAGQSCPQCHEGKIERTGSCIY
mgnify:CR=1 FL=1|jgi:hypothetical protein